MSGMMDPRELAWPLLLCVVVGEMPSSTIEAKKMRFKKFTIAALPLAAFLFTAPVTFAHEFETHGEEHQELNAEHGFGHEELNAEHGNAHENLEAEHEWGHQFEMTPWQHRLLHERLNREHALAHENLQEEHEAQHENLEAQHQQYHYYHPRRWWGRPYYRSNYYSPYFE